MYRHQFLPGPVLALVSSRWPRWVDLSSAAATLLHRRERAVIFGALPLSLEFSLLRRRLRLSAFPARNRRAQVASQIRALSPASALSPGAAAHRFPSPPFPPTNRAFDAFPRPSITITVHRRLPAPGVFESRSSPLASAVVSPRLSSVDQRRVEVLLPSSERQRPARLCGLAHHGDALALGNSRRASGTSCLSSAAMIGSLSEPPAFPSPQLCGCPYAALVSRMRHLHDGAPCRLSSAEQPHVSSPCRSASLPVSSSAA